MRKFSILLFVMAMISCPFNIVAQRILVLSVGVSNYEGGDGNLRLAAKDAKAFKSVMSKHTDDIIIMTSKYAMCDSVLSKLRKISELATEQDLVIFFFSGHGCNTYNGGAICAYDGNIYYQDIVKELKKSKARYKLCFIDACHSGSAFGSIDAKGKKDATTDSVSFQKQWIRLVEKSQKNNGNIIVFASSRSSEYSYEGRDQSYFTKSVTEGLRGRADYDSNSSITVRELFKYVHDATVKSIGQHPTLIVPRGFDDCVIINLDN